MTTVREVLRRLIPAVDEHRIARSGDMCKALGIDPDVDLDTHRLVAVPNEVSNADLLRIVEWAEQGLWENGRDPLPNLDALHAALEEQA